MFHEKKLLVFALALTQSTVCLGVLRFSIISVNPSPYFIQEPSELQARSDIAVDDGRPIYKDLAPIKPKEEMTDFDRKATQELIMTALKQYEKKDRFTKPSEDIYSTGVAKENVEYIYAFKPDVELRKPELVKKPKLEDFLRSNDENLDSVSGPLSDFLFKKTKKPLDLGINVPSLTQLRAEESNRRNPFGFLHGWSQIQPSGRTQKILELLR